MASSSEEPIFVQGSLGEKVDRLTERVTIAQTVATRLRNAVIGLAILTLLLGYGGFQLWQVAEKANSAAEDAHAAALAVEEAAVVNCQNLNEQREKTRILWSFALQASGRPDPDDPDTPKEVKFRQEFGDWVNALYAERDCSDLNKKVELPPPPSLE